jgi:hypothetical protein
MEDKNTFRFQESGPYVKFEPNNSCLCFFLAKFSPPGNNKKNSSGTHTKDFDDSLFSEIAVVFRQWVPVGCQNI